MKKKILVIRFSSLGDVILTSAPLLNLKISFPESYIVYLTKESYRGLVETFDGVDEIVTIPDKVSYNEYFELLLKLDNYNFDIIIDWHGNFRSWLAGKIITATKRLVYPKRRLERMLLVKRKKIPSKWPHTIDLYNDCIRQLGGMVAASRPIINPPHIIENESLFKKGSDASYIVIAPGAAHYNKQWPTERFVETALSLNREHRVKVGTALPWRI